jgi:Polyketide cyclase / dehydrase and lipid transport
MARITGEIVIDRPQEQVFDFVSDERNEPRYNPKMTSVEQLSEGAIGPGTQFKAEVLSGGRRLWTVIEFTTFDRPARLASRATMPGMVILGELTFEAVGETTRMRWAWDLKPSGALWLLTPFVALIGGRQERDIWTSLKRCLEA